MTSRGWLSTFKCVLLEGGYLCCKKAQAAVPKRHHVGGLEDRQHVEEATYVEEAQGPVPVSQQGQVGQKYHLMHPESIFILQTKFWGVRY